jgi:hypothetical protein
LTVRLPTLVVACEALPSAALDGDEIDGQNGDAKLTDLVRVGWMRMTIGVAGQWRSSE